MKIQMQYNLLDGMSRLASTDEIRFVLNGVLLIIENPGKDVPAKLVATDGRRLGIQKCTVTSDVAFPAGVILPIPDFRRLGLSAKSGVKEIEITFGPDPMMSSRQVVTYTSHITGFSQTLGAIEGCYPRFEQVIPGEFGHITCLNVNLELLKGFTEVCRLVTQGDAWHSIHVRSHGDGKAISVFTNDPGFYGVIMPIREDREFDIPAWAKPDPKPAPAPVPEAVAAEPAETNRITTNGHEPVTA